MQPHVFEIDYAVWHGLAEDEISSTVEAMQELGIYNMPYEGKIIIRIPMAMENGKGFIEASGLSEDENFDEQMVVYPKVPLKGLAWYKANPAKCESTENGPLQDLGIGVEGKAIVHRFRFLYPPREGRKYYCDGLIVLLASKGLVKQSKERKLAKLGIGKAGGVHVTTIKMAENLESHESVRSGSPVRPHLRRGHIRSQHYGQGNQFVKRIWIEPVFVNADENFVSTRKAYRVIH